MLHHALRQWRVLAFTLLLPALATAQSGSVDPSFNVGTGANNRIFAMAAQPDGSQIIGGTFTNYAGNTVNRLARITRTGAFDNTFTIGTGPNGQVTAIAVDAAGRVLIGGSFSMYNGVQRARLARLDRKSTRLNSSHATLSRMPSSA